MRSFLVKDKKPLWKFKDHPEGVLFKGKVPDGYDLAVSPTPGYIIIDVDRHGDKDGFENIPEDIYRELAETFNYPTRGNGAHFWFKYTGSESLANKTSPYSIDIRTHKGYVVLYKPGCIMDYIGQISESSPLMNEWIESIFKAKTKLKR